MSSYRLSRLAERDLTEIRNYAAQHDAAAAIDLLDRLITRFEELAERPLVGRSREDLRTGLRSSVLGVYLIFYRAKPCDVEIVRVVHGRRDLIRLF